MAANKCTSCFYAAMDKDLEAPCKFCTGYSNWVPRDMYQPMEDAMDAWYKRANGVIKGDFKVKYDSVNKPKHYMLFEHEGIEVRDVLAKLADKIKLSDNRVPLWEIAPLFEADYVQMMQYLMRFMDKNGVEDLKKAEFYLKKLIEAYDESDV